MGLGGGAIFQMKHKIFTIVVLQWLCICLLFLRLRVRIPMGKILTYPFAILKLQVLRYSGQ